MKTNFRIGLTGSTGFLGSRISQFFKNNNYSFYSYGRTKNPLASKNISLDFSNKFSKEFCESLQEIDVLIHMASKTVTRYAENTNFSEFYEINTIGTERLIRKCYENNLSQFIFISTTNFLKPINGIVNENSSYGDCRQSPYYLSSKIAAEIVVKSFQNKNMNIKIIRPSSIYGHGMNQGVVKKFLNKIIANEKLTISGFGNWGSDLIYVDDVAQAIISLIFKNFDGPINIGTGKLTTVKEIAYDLCNLLNSPYSLIEFDKKIKELDSLPKIEMKMARELINFEPISFKKGINLMVKDYMNKL